MTSASELRLQINNPPAPKSRGIVYSRESKNAAPMPERIAIRDFLHSSETATVTAAAQM